MSGHTLTCTTYNFLFRAQMGNIRKRGLPKSDDTLTRTT